MPMLPRPISASLDKVARDAVGRDWALYATLLDHWREIVGEDYAQNTAPVKIVFPKGKKLDEKWASRRSGGTLHIRLPQGLTMEFSFLTDTIRARINGFFGYSAIEKVVFEPFYPEKPPVLAPEAPPLSAEAKESLAEDTKDIDNDELRDLLQQLGESMLSRTE